MVGRHLATRLRAFLSHLSPLHAPTAFPSSPQGAAENENWWRAASRQTAQLGLKYPAFLISFDCDRPEDAVAAVHVDRWLRERDISRVYAVPGVMLYQERDTYARLASDGATFINHGGRAHAEFRNGRYWSVTFYDRFTEEETADDIMAGHRAVQDVTGQIPTGFRAPHFGLLKTGEQRENIYRILREMKYRFSSSTLPPVMIEQCGAAHDKNGIVEIPCSGGWHTPTVILDSWSHIQSPYYPVVTETYEQIMIRTFANIKNLGLPIFLNWYADPSHLGNGDGFKRALDKALECGFSGIDFTELLETIDLRGQSI